MRSACSASAGCRRPAAPLDTSGTPGGRPPVQTVGDVLELRADRLDSELVLGVNYNFGDYTDDRFDALADEIPGG